VDQVGRQEGVLTGFLRGNLPKILFGRPGKKWETMLKLRWVEKRTVVRNRLIVVPSDGLYF
jgi:hypothetical protein